MSTVDERYFEKKEFKNVSVENNGEVVMVTDIDIAKKYAEQNREKGNYSVMFTEIVDEDVADTYEEAEDEVPKNKEEEKGD